MDKIITIIARKYANAFVNVFGDTLSVNDLPKIHNAIEHVQNIINLSFFLHLPSIENHVKKNALTKLLLTEYQLPSCFEGLIDLLVLHKRTFLIVPIMRVIDELLMEKKGIQFFTISSSHELTDAQKKNVAEFLAQKTDFTIMNRYIIDKKLIAGIRLQSNTLLWEDSIKKYLNNVRKELTQ